MWKLNFIQIILKWKKGYYETKNFGGIKIVKKKVENIFDNLEK